MTEALLIFLFSTFILITAAIVVYIYSAITQKDIVSKEKLREYKDKFINNLKSRYVFYGVVITIFLLIIYYGINIFSAQIREISYKPPSPPAPISAETLGMYAFAKFGTSSTVLFLLLLTPVIIFIFLNPKNSIYKLFLPEATLVIALLTTPLTLMIASNSAFIASVLVLFAPLSLFYFPTGLLAITSQALGWYYSDGMILATWGGYLLIILISKFVKDHFFYIVLYTILVAILSVNIAGCSISAPDMLSNIN